MTFSHCRTKTVLWIVATLAGVAAVVFYWFFDPLQTAWMPRCPFRLLTGWSCPACGNQRALHALLHGHIAEAWHFNRFLILSLPYFAAVLWTTFSHGTLARRWRSIVQHPQVIMAFFGLTVGWWIGRNIFDV